MRSKPFLHALSFFLVLGFCWISIACWDAPVAIHCSSLDKKVSLAFEVMASFGYSTYYLIGLFVVMLIFKFVYKSNYYALVALFLFLAIASSGLAVDALKFILGRSRPRLLIRENLFCFQPFQIESDMTSFPSGHASTITSLMLALYYFYPKYKYLYVAAAVLVAGSRVVIAAHYLSDVVFGAYLALVITPFLKSRFEKAAYRIFRSSAPR